MERLLTIEKLLNSSLYEKIEFEEIFFNFHFILELCFLKETTVFHCTECGENRPFQNIPMPDNTSYITSASPNITPTIFLHNFQKILVKEKHLPVAKELLSQIPSNPYIYTRFECTLDKKHKASFIFRLDGNTIQKIGQFPSVADLKIHEIEKYKVVLKKEYNEFSKAIGLISHGVGVGSFVYLRRIFEHLLEEAHQEALNSPSWDEDRYQRERVSEKIGLLSGFLPSFLVEHRAIYGILSKGIHELEENECKEFFPVIKSAIEIILDDKLAKMEAQKKKDQISKQINEISSKLKK